MIGLEDPSLERDGLLAALHARGVWMGPSGPGRIRAITHLDVDDAGIDRAVNVFGSVVEGMSGVGRRPSQGHATVPRLGG